MKIDSYFLSLAGGREYNEDATGQKKLSDGAVFVLADGLGGHRGGDLASACVVESLTGAQWPPFPEQLQSALQQNIELADEAVRKLQKEQRGRMRSTVVALVISGEYAAWGHVGDSRLYYIHQDQLNTVTEDHSVAYKKYKAGEIRKSQVGSDEDQSSLLRALGAPDRSQCDIEEVSEPLSDGDGFLLCSDGLWEYVRDQEVLVDFLKTDSAEEWGRMLLLRAFERIQPGNDNLSLIAVRIGRESE